MRAIERRMDRSRGAAAGRWRWLPGALVLAFGGAASIAAFVGMDRIEEERTAHLFELWAQERTGRVRSHVEALLRDLQAFRAGRLTLPDFSALAGEWIPRHPGVQAVVWLPRIGRAEREKAESAAPEADGAAAAPFTITERDAQGRIVRAGDRDAYFPAIAIEPADARHVDLGFDHAAVPPWRYAMDQAVDDGALAASAGTTIRRADGTEGTGVLLFMPAFGEGRTGDSRADRVFGYLAAVLDVGALLDAALGDSPARGLDVVLQDATDPADVQVLDAHGPASRIATSGAGEPALRRVTPFPLAGRTWEVVCESTPELVAHRRFGLAHLVLLAGVLLTLLAFAFVEHVRRRTGIVEREVAHRTAELAATNRVLAEIRGQLEHRVEDRTRELVAANRELEAFCYSVSHDLRAPLRAMDGFSRILLQDHESDAALPEDTRRRLGAIRRNAVRMGALIDDLLAFSRLSRQPMKMERVDVAAMARRIADELAAENPGREVRVEVADLPPAYGDPALVRQVLVNLLSNAFKYTRPRAHARIAVGALPGDAARPVYFVKDDGVGFDMRHADKLFGVFQRLHRADEYEGTGIGLALVERIVRRHGGSIRAEAAVDAGATFFFTLGEERGGEGGDA